MVLHVVGLGLGTEQDITLRGLAAIKKCKKVYLEAYTSILTVPKEKLEELYGVAIEIAHRELCESGIEPIIERARTEDVAMLVVWAIRSARPRTATCSRAPRSSACRRTSCTTRRS